VGEQALTDDDRRILHFVADFERRFVGQQEQRRSIEETLDLAWDLLAPFPAADLRRIKPELIERHRPSPS
jgi:V/A-type H+-transporting ATPase subunit B